MFLTTAGVSYKLEEIFKTAEDQLVLISPYLRFNPRIKELLEDKNRLKLDIRVVYSKTDLADGETQWLKGLKYVKLGFCEHLHAKCYLNEKETLLTSMKLYEVSQGNNHEMGIAVNQASFPGLYAGKLHTHNGGYPGRGGSDPKLHRHSLVCLSPDLSACSRPGC